MRLIDADLLEKIFVKAHCFDCAEGNQKKFNACRNGEIKPLCESFSFKYLIDSLPTIDAVEVVHGEWIDEPIKGVRYHCSVCSGRFDYMWKYCPNCGAKMDGEAKSDEMG